MQSSALLQMFLGNCGHSPSTSRQTLLIATSCLAVFCSENGKCLRAQTLCIYPESVTVTAGQVTNHKYKPNTTTSAICIGAVTTSVQ